MKPLILSIMLLPGLTIASTLTPKVKNLASFANFAENIAVRSNGHLLVTSLTSPSIYTLDPTNPNLTSTITQLPPIPNVNGISGIVEIGPTDLFIVAAGFWNTTARRAENNSLSLWTVDMRPTVGGKQPSLQKLVDIQNTTTLNGLTGIVHSNGFIVLAADSALGLLYRVYVEHAHYDITLDAQEYDPSPEASSLGVNGIHTLYNPSDPDLESNRAVYFTNSAQGTFNKQGITRMGASYEPVHTIARFNISQQVPDDFAFDKQGRAWITLHPSSIARVDGKGNVDVVVSGMSIVPDPTSAAFGRGSEDQEAILYVTTNVIGGEGVMGGVVGIDTKGL